MNRMSIFPNNAGFVARTGTKTALYSDAQVYRCCVKLLIVSLLLIAAATLFPYDFSVVPQVKESSSNDYFLDHLLLFVPLGFGLAPIVQKRGEGKLRELFIVLLVSGCLSVVTEMLQVFLPARSVSLSDGVANILGAFLGIGIFAVVRPHMTNHISRIGRAAKRFLAVKVVVAISLGYIAIIFSMSVLLQRTTSLTTWEDKFPLLLGNEQTGNRPWQGRISQLAVADRSLSASEIAQMFAEKGLAASLGEPLVVLYRFGERGYLEDRARHLPKLVWRGQTSNEYRGEDGFLSADHWLETSLPAAYLSQALKKTSQFTLAATVSAADLTQGGPARIISFSQDPYQRNFTLGQSGRSLVFRLRTSLTGKNGMKPELVVPDVFVNHNPLFIAITYDGSIVRVFVNGLRRASLQFVPEAKLFSYWFNITTDTMKGFMVLYYGLVFVPIGILLAFFNKVSNYPPAIRRVAAGVSIVVPAAVLESVLTGVMTMRSGHVFLAMVFTAGAMLLFHCLESI